MLALKGPSPPTPLKVTWTWIENGQQGPGHQVNWQSHYVNGTLSGYFNTKKVTREVMRYAWDFFLG